MSEYSLCSSCSSLCLRYLPELSYQWGSCVRLNRHTKTLLYRYHIPTALEFLQRSTVRTLDGMERVVH